MVPLNTGAMPSMATRYENGIEGAFRHYLYRFEDREGVPYYVGITSNPHLRARAHGNPCSDLYVDQVIREQGIENFTMIMYEGDDSHSRIHDREIAEMIRLRTLKYMFPDNPNACNIKRSGPNFFHDLPEEVKNLHREKARRGQLERYNRMKESGEVNPKSIPVYFAGQNFESQKAAAKVLKVRPGTLRKWLKQGLDDFPEDYLRIKNRTIIWQGQKFKSLTDAANAAKVNKSTMHGWLARGLTDYPPGWDREIKWMGGTYRNCPEASKATGIPTHEIYRHMEKGRTEPPKFKFEDTSHRTIWGGKEYRSVRSISRKTGIPVSLVQKWVKAGLSDVPEGYCPRTGKKESDE